MKPLSMLLCEPACQLDESFLRLYESAFPASEKEPTARLKRLLAEGRILFHRTLNEKGELLCFTITLLGENLSILGYMATDSSKRSSGVGKKHLLRLIELLKIQYPHHIGLFLEIEDTAPSATQALSKEERAIRIRRRRFYEEKIGARVLCADGMYFMPSYTNRGTFVGGELLVIEFGKPLCRETTVRAIKDIFRLAYKLPADHRMVVKLLNNFDLDARCDSKNPITLQKETPMAETKSPQAGGVDSSSVRRVLDKMSRESSADKLLKSAASAKLRLYKTQRHIANPGPHSSWQKHELRVLLYNDAYRTMTGKNSASDNEILDVFFSLDAQNWLATNCVNEYWFWRMIHRAADGSQKSLPLKRERFVFCNALALAAAYHNFSRQAGTFVGADGQEEYYEYDHLKNAFKSGLLFLCSHLVTCGLDNGMVLLTPTDQLSWASRLCRFMTGNDQQGLVLNPLFCR